MRPKHSEIALAVAALTAACVSQDGTQPTNVGTAREFISSPSCGNLVLEDGEDCDDGNQVNGDLCDSDCVTGVNMRGLVPSADTNCVDYPGQNPSNPNDPTRGRLRKFFDSLPVKDGLGARRSLCTWCSRSALLRIYNSPARHGVWKWRPIPGP